MFKIENYTLDKDRVESILQAYEKALYQRFLKNINPIKDIFEEDDLTYDVFRNLYEKKLEKNKEEIRLRFNGNKTELEQKLSEIERNFLATIQYLKDEYDLYPAISVHIYEVLRSIGHIN